MSTGSMTSRGAVAVLSASALLVPGSALGEETCGAETPEAVYTSVVEAAEKEDVGAMFACLAPDERAEMTMMMVVMSGFMVGMAGMAAEMGEETAEALAEDGSLQKAEAEAELAAMTERWEEILERHGLAELMDASGDFDETVAAESGSSAEALAGVDQAALVNDLVAFLSEFGDEGSGASHTGPMGAPIGELEDLAIDGDSATGRVGDEEVRFLRVDGRWYVSTGGLDELD